MTQRVADRSRWIQHIKALTDGVLEAVPFGADASVRAGYIEEFRDEFGNRRASDRAFLSHTLGVSMSALRSHDEMALDERLWWCAMDQLPVPHGLLSADRGLVLDPDALAIEYRTMVELCALQALWCIALQRDQPALIHRALEAARWHIEELQPDNAINRPWGLPVFVELALRVDEEVVSQTAELHAQTLLHNACINFGKPDLLSAVILHQGMQLLAMTDQ